MPLPGDGEVSKIGIDRLAEEILLTPVPLPSTPPEGDLWRWLQAMVAREAGNADVVLKRHANIQIEDHATALEKLRQREPEQFSKTIQLDSNFPEQPIDYRLVADHAKIKAMQIARLRANLVRLLHTAPLPQWLRTEKDWQRASDVHASLLVAGARALHVNLGADQRLGEKITTFLNRAVRRRWLSRSAADTLLRLAQTVDANRSAHWDAFGTDEEIGHHLIKRVLQESQALAVYDRSQDEAPLPFTTTFVDLRLGVTPGHAMVLVALNLIAAWKWIDAWLGAKLGNTPLVVDHAELLMPRKLSKWPSTALYETTDFLRCDGVTDQHAVRDADFENNKQSRKIAPDARQEFSRQFPYVAQSRLGIAPWLWLTV